MAESSCPSSEIQGNDHKYQILTKPGPRGAYESRQVNGGFYVRVDMPGVPPDGVKIVKRGEKRTVTFTGKAPVLWNNYETSGRVYGGYVVLDRNPDEVVVEMTVVNGCLRLFFPACDGVLHSFPRKSSGLKDMCLQPGAGECSCCDEAQKNGESAVLRMMAMTHINPYLLDGKEGVIERMLVSDHLGDLIMYTRIDVPGLEKKTNKITIIDQVSFYCGGEGSKEHHLDEGGRTYAACLRFRCTCCKMVDAHSVTKDGVIRILICKQTDPESSGIGCMVDLLQMTEPFSC